MTQSRRIRSDELKPGDILLSRGHGLISDLIVRADGGHYSHGALWSGSGIIQATSAGIKLSTADGMHDVYRHVELSEPGGNEVVVNAEKQLNGSYAYGELVMLGLLFTTGLRVRGAILSNLLDAIGPKASKLKAWLDEQAGKRTRVCTELVASCYYKTAGHRFAIKVLPIANRPHAAPVTDAGPELPPLVADGAPGAGVRRGPVESRMEPSAEELSAAAQSCRELFAREGLLLADAVRGTSGELAELVADEHGQTRKFLAEAIARNALDGTPIGVVTPADLEFSPSLNFVGRFEA